LQPLEDVLKEHLAVIAAEGVLDDLHEIGLGREVQLVRGDFVQLVLELRFGDRVFAF